jgi:hypothetical protein
VFQGSPNLEKHVKKARDRVRLRTFGYAGSALRT